MRTLAVGAFAAALTSIAPAAGAVTIGQVDTFASGTTEGWFAGGGPFGATPPVPPTVIATGGPAGAGDAFLQLSASGSAGAGGRLVGMNASQWAGDYLAAGVTAISMDLRNLGATDLSMRLYFEDPIPGPPVNEAVTSFAADLAAGGDWTRVLFPITAADLASLAGDVPTLLSATTILRLFHGSATDFPGEPIAGLLGVDNITAIGARDGALPLPGGLALMLSGLGLLGIGWCAGSAVTRARERRASRGERAATGWQPAEEPRAGSSPDDADDYLNEPTPHTM